jgi:hypothetical protein
MKTFRTYPAVFLVSAATLTYEIGLTRLFSLAQGYHFAFMVISIALMGIGAGGAALMVFGWNGQRDASKALATLSALLSIAVVISYLGANHILFDPVKASWSKSEFFKIFAQYLILSLPFIITGMIISLALRSGRDRVHRIYASDLAGAAAGCVLILLILAGSGGEGAVTGAAALSLAASFIFSAPTRSREAAAPGTALVLLVLVLLDPGELLRVNISPYRDLSAARNFPGARVVETLHSAFGRMDIIDSPAVRAAPGISLSYQSPLPPQLGFTINGGGLSTVTSREGDLSFLTHLPSALAYRLRENGDVFVVDPGGGMELLSALENGASDVMGAESNAVVIEGMRGRLSVFSGGLYDEVSVIQGYGRNVLKDLKRRFDIIQLPRTGTLGSSSSGIRGLQEDYSLTAEGFGEYLDHLKRGGFVSVSMYLLPPPRQELKLLSTVVRALGEKGVGAPGDRIIAIRSWGVLVLLVKNGRVGAPDIAALKAFSSSEGFDLVWYPGMRPDEANVRNRFKEPVYHNLFRRVLDGPAGKDFMEEYIFDVRPATDDRPFFGQTFKMTRMKDTFESVGRKWGILIEGAYLLPWILLQAAAASFMLIIAPLAFMKRTQTPPGTLMYTCAYFAAIGIGFMFVEISLIYKMMPVLGSSVYAISVVLSSILISTGAGSFLSGRLRVMERYSANVILVVPVLIFTYIMGLGPLSEVIVGFTAAPRYILTFILIFPLGVTMGVPFPAGMALLGRRRPGLIPWAWCINGSFSVVSSILVMMVALAWGFRAALIIAAAVYACAWLALTRLCRNI